MINAIQYSATRAGSACVCFYRGCNGLQVSMWFVTAVWLVQWMMGNAVQCDVWCESQYDGEDDIWFWANGSAWTGFVTIVN